MPRLLRRLLIVLVILALIVAALWWASRPEPVQVVLATVEHGPVEASVTNTRAGSVESCQRTKLSTIQGGRIDYLGVKEGDRVRAGQVLLRLWNEDQQAGLGLARAQLTSTHKRVAEACALAEQAERDAARQARLRAQGFVSINAEDAAQAQARSRRASCESAEAEVARARAQVHSAEVELARTVLVAPFAGTVASITGELGEYSTPSPPGVQTPPAIDLIDDTCLYVSAPMDETDAPRIRAGLPARITVDALPGKRFEARVRRIAPYVSAVEKQARTVEVELDFASAEQAAGLLVGYSADAEVVLEVRERVLRVPTATLLDGNQVLLLGSDGKLVARRVKTGLANWEYTEVLEGLQAGERIVSSLEREGVKAGVAAVAEPGEAETAR